jgi:hypothetical protein
MKPIAYLLYTVKDIDLQPSPFKGWPFSAPLLVDPITL